VQGILSLMEVGFIRLIIRIRVNNMRLYRPIMTRGKDLVDIFCNKCQKELDLNFGEIDISIEHGFGSKYDFEIHKFDLCNTCYDEFILSFKIPVTTKDAEF